MIRRLVIFLIRKKLGLRTYEPFRFDNQKTDAIYCFTNDAVMKDWCGIVQASSVSLNWLLHDDCKIIKLSEEELSK